MSDNKTSFITNEGENTLAKKFEKVLPVTKSFDCLVGYFYISGFHKLQKSLENTKKIRILVGMGIDSQTFQLIENPKVTNIPTAEYKKHIQEDVITEMTNSDDNIEVEIGSKQFLDWLQSKKIEIRGYKERKTHSKLYIMNYDDTQVGDGMIITGSSNFTQPGLEKNLELNVELQRVEDYDFALKTFENLWEHSEPISEDFVNTLKHG